MVSRAILAPRNRDVDAINDTALHIMPGEERAYTSADNAINSQGIDFSMEFLNSIDVPGLPPHQLNLKVGAPAVLLRNLNGTGGANGTRVIIRALSTRVVMADVLTGAHAGTTMFIPRITLEADPKDTGMPFTLRRRQFPLRLAFALTIHKSQGQTYRRVGVFLPDGCFSHGQLYVALSRVGNPNAITVMAQRPEAAPDDGETYTTNVVWQEALVN